MESGTIRVLKRDRSVELFDARKLAAAMWRAMPPGSASFDHVRRLAEAVDVYLRRQGRLCISSSAVFEMTVKALRVVGFAAAAEAAESYRDRREMLRTQLRILDSRGKLRFWGKSWLCELACSSWHISPTAARILAGKVERRILRCAQWVRARTCERLRLGRLVVSRQTVVDLLNQCTSEYGLADAVPVGR